MDQFIYIKNFNDINQGDYIKIHIITDLQNIDNKITKEGVIKNIRNFYEKYYN